MIELDPSLINDFVTEAGEHLEEMEAVLLRLSDEPENRELFNEVFRPIHTIKGASQFLGLEKIATLSHRLEDLLDLLRKGEKASSPAIIDVLIEGRDRITLLVSELENPPAEETSTDDLVALLQRLIAGEEPEALGSSPSETPPAAPEPESGSQDHDQPVAATVDSAKPSENYQEEHDVELFDIFIEQMKEKVSFLLGHLYAQDPAADKIELLAAFLENVDSLKTSANYMGYESLKIFYDDWCDEIQTAQTELLLGSEVPLDFMETYVGKLINLFPQLASVFETLGSEDTACPEEPVADLSDDEAATVESILSGIEQSTEAEEPVATDGDVDSVEELVAAAAGNALENEAADDVADITAEQPVHPEQAPAPVTSIAEAQSDEHPKPQEQRPTNQNLGERVFKKSVRVDANKIDSLMNQVGELIVDRSYFSQLFNEVKVLQQQLREEYDLDPTAMKSIRAFSYRLNEAIVSLGRTSNDLQESVMKIRMLPISQLFSRYPRLVHDLTHNTEKRVQLEIKGEETELDRMVIEELSDPLIHIIRNAVDHGMETTTERLSKGKPEAGTLTLEAYHESNYIVIEITDDGRGIDPARIKAKGAARGLYTSEELERMSVRELTRLIMLPGFSTAEKVSDTSGRGVGMDVVKKNIEKLNGIIEVDSEVGVRTQIRLKIPLTLAIIQALIVRVGQDFFTVPLANVEETLRVFEHETSTIEGTEVIHLRNKTLPTVRLSQLFHMPSKGVDEKTFVVVVNSGFQRIGLVVDELMGQEEVVIKPLVDYLQEKSGFSGATIIGDGQISLILDIYELVNMATNRQIARHQRQANSLRRQLV